MLRTSSRRWLHLMAAVVVFVLLAVPIWVTANERHGIQAAWERAQSAGRYAFTSDLRQVTTPLASLTNVGQRSTEHRLHLEGQTDLRRSNMEVTLWANSGSAAQSGTGLSLRVSDGKTWQRAGTGAWQPADDMTSGVAPQGDFMAYLQSARDVEAHAPETRGNLRFTRYTFRIDGPTFARHVTEQLEVAMRQQAALQPGAHLALPDYFVNMTGEGELLVGENGLPLRQTVNLHFPPQDDKQVDAHIVADFSQFGTPAVAMLGLWRVEAAVRDLAADPAPLLGVLVWLLSALAVIRFRTSSVLHRAIPILVIAAMLAGPLLSGIKSDAYFQAQTVQAAEQQTSIADAERNRELRRELTTSSWEPNADPVAAAYARATALDNTQAPQTEEDDFGDYVEPVLTIDNGADSDGDGLTDYTEQRLGTSSDAADDDGDGVPNGRDTDGDFVPDDREVNGFDFDGKRWYTDPLQEDTNRDGTPDGSEWFLDQEDLDGNNAPDGNGIPDNLALLDRDNDRIPDMFDDDNDGDGVVDALDSAPNMQSNPGNAANGFFGPTRPFLLDIQHLQTGKLTYVDFQLRPKNPDHLWFSRNVLDWPTDVQGQIQDGDGATFGTSGAEAYGDMKLLPMLELKMSGTGGNLPTASERAQYNIILNPLPDYPTAGAAGSVAYVPLSLQSDGESGAQVAFTGRMLYRPTAALGTQQVRLVWAVQMLGDVCKDVADEVCSAYDEQNQVQIVHTYDDEWALTGLTVRENHGTKLAIVNEDPAADPDLKDDGNLALLSSVLDDAFLGGRDVDKNGQRDLTVEEIARRMNRTTNASVPAAQRWELPNLFNVAWDPQRNSYNHLDEAVIATTVLETKRVLNTQFGQAWTADHTIKPLLMFVHEDRSRNHGSEMVALGDGSAAYANDRLTLNMGTGAAAMPVDTVADLKWASYCADQTAQNEPSWEACDHTVYWEELGQRYAQNTNGDLATDPDVADINRGRVLSAQLYYLSLAQGINNIVQRGTTIVIPTYKFKTDNEHIQNTYDAKKWIKEEFKTVGGLVWKYYFDNTTTGADGTKKQTASFLKLLGDKVKGGFDPFQERINVKVVNNIASQFKNKALATTVAKAGVAIAVVALLAVGVGLVAHFWTNGSPQEQKAAQAAVSKTIIGISLIMAAVSSARIVYNMARYTFASAMAAVAFGTVAFKAGFEAFQKTAAFKAGLSKGGIAGGFIGAAFEAGFALGFFIFNVVSNAITAFSPAFNRGLAEVIATTIYYVAEAIIASTIVGLIIISILKVIDAILGLICALGDVNELRQVPGMGGACFSIAGGIIKIIAKLFYSYDVMIDTGHKTAGESDLMLTGSPDVELADPNRGYIAAQSFSVTMPVTTTIVHKNPPPENFFHILPYMWFFNQDNLRSSTFQYSLTKDKADISASRDVMKRDWRVREDHKFALTPMYRGQDATTAGPVRGISMPPGLNQTAGFFLNQGYALPAYECWTIVIPTFWLVWIPVPVCYTRTFNGNNSNYVDIIKYDIFPNTLDEFMTMADKGNGGRGLAWDAKFPALHDADGDGLVSSAYGGFDNDSAWDTDSDGLSDTFEFERRIVGVPFSPTFADNDRDGLTDKQEIEFGTYPARADTDNDGLDDGEEVYHQVYAFNSTTSRYAPTNHWEGGWDVTLTGIRLPNGTLGSRVVRVSSNPTMRDSDGDGIPDSGERQLAQAGGPNALDRNKVPYHPLVPNTNPLQISVASSDPDGIVGPNQPFNYSTTVTTDGQPFAPGVLNVTLPPELDAAGRYPIDLSASPVTVVAPVSVNAGAASGNVTVASRVSGRLQDPGGPDWVWQPVVPDSKTNFATQARQTDLASANAGRSDTYLLQSAIAPAPPGLTAYDQITPGDIRADAFPGAQSRIVESDASNTSFLLGPSDPSVACNDDNTCLTVWDTFDNCATVTIDRLYIQSEGDDPNGGIEPRIFFKPAGGFERLVWNFAGGLDEDAGETFGPNSDDFPLVLPYCGSADIRVAESDGHGDELIETHQIGSWPAGPRSELFDSPDNAHDIRLDFTIEHKQRHIIAGAMVNPDTTVQRSQFAASNPVVRTAELEDYAPAVASDGSNFLVAWEQRWGNANNEIAIHTQLIDGTGNKVSGASAVLPIPTSYVSRSVNTVSDIDVAWAGDRYLVVWKYPQRGHISAVALNRNGTVIAGSEQTLTSTAAIGAPGAPSLAYNPANDQILLVYRDNAGNIRRQLGHDGIWGSAATLANSSTLPRAAYHPPSQGWIVGWKAQDATYRYTALASNGSLLTVGSAENTTWTPGTTSSIGSALACPSPHAQPQVDLRFEEIPGATSFADASGRNRQATPGSGVAGPLAGARGAEERAAPYSDYALEFDGVDDYATLANVAQDDFSVAFWLKSNQVSGTDGAWHAGAGLAAGSDYGVSLLNGKVHFGVGDPTTTIRTTARVADDAWHFVVATRNKSTGALRLYVDGVVQSDQRNGSTAALAPGSVRLGSLANGSNPYRGLLDHVRFFDTALDGNTVKEMFDRTLQSYCMAAAPRIDTNANDAVNGNGISFARLELRQRDRRGAGPFQSNVADLRIRIDNERPSSTITSLDDNQYIQGTNGQPTTIIIGGDASDRTSGVVKVEVSVNGGAWQPATGTATWAFALAVTEGRYQIQTRATDAVNNVEAPAPAMSVYVDATAPTTTIAASAAPALPRRTLDDQWEVTLQGSITDPAIGRGSSAPGSGVAPASVEVLLQSQDNGPGGNDWQRATIQGTTWRLPYRFNTGLLDPTGTFTATVRAQDVIGNQTTISDPSFDVDITGPQVLGSAALGQLELISDTRTIAGTATDTGAAGLQDVAVAFRPVEQVVALSGTVLLLPFDERPGSLWYTDGTPNRRDARCADPADCPQAGEAGRIDQAVRFNGGAMVEVPHNDAFDFTAAESFSVQTWLRTAAADGTRTLLSKRATDGQGYALQLRNGNATLVLNDVAVSGGADLRDDRWHHVMAVVDRTAGQAILYVDGMEQGSATFTGSTANSAALQIGGMRGVPAEAFNGLIDQALILERALLPEEIPTLVAAADVPWRPATLAQQGTLGPRTWSYQVPEGLEGLYQIDLRGVDRLGNRAQSANVWRGTIDTSAPRVRITATDTGASYIDLVSNTRMHAVAFTCVAVDRNLTEQSFDCPGNTIQPPVRAFDRNPELQALFPDLTARDGLMNSYTLWVPATQLDATLRACDSFAHCTTASATAVLDPNPDPNVPRAVVVAPTNGRYVAANGTVPVPVVATSGQALRQFELFLDNTLAATLSFAESEAVTRTQRTLAVAVATEGPHTLVARATDWSGVTQSRLIPVRFVLDSQPPVVTIDASPLTIDDTYGLQSDVLRFRGTASDTGGVVAVQVRIDDGFFAEASFGNGRWQIAVPVTDPEGKSLAVTVRAIDRAGRITTINQTIGVDLSTTNPPDTAITTAPSNPSLVDPVSFRFTGTPGSADVASFACRIDDASFTTCGDPQLYAELGKGTHTFQVRAIDARGYVDPTPATYTWTVSPIQPETFVSAAPPLSSTSRDATFIFNGADGTARFECSLDGSPFAPCASPQRLSSLGYGKHTFRVRALDGAGKAGSPTDWTWTVLNTPPVAASQRLLMDEGRSLNITLVASDTDQLVYNVIGQPQHGVLSGIAPNLVYTPDANYAGLDSFTFTASDGEATSNVGTVDITVRLGKYVLFAQEGASIEQQTTINSGDIGVNVANAGPFLRNGAELSIGQKTRMVDPASRVAADTIVLGQDSSIANAGYNSLTGAGEVRGTRATPLLLPLRAGLPSIPVATPGTQNVSVAQHQTATLAAGRYGALTARPHSIVRFTGGVYHFQSWQIDHHVQAVFLAPTEIRIAGRLAVAQHTYIGPAPATSGVDANNIMIYVAGQNGQNGALGAAPRSAVFAQSSKVFAYMVVPNGTLELGHQGEATGVFIAKWLQVAQQVKLTKASAPPAP